MNILEIIVFAIGLIFAAAGFRKGFVKKLAAVISLALSIVLVSVFLPYITQFLKDRTPVYEFIVDQCTNIIEGQAGKTLLTETAENDSSAGDMYRSLGREQIKALMEQNGYDSSIVDILSDEQLEQYKEQYIQQYLGGGDDTDGAQEQNSTGGDGSRDSLQILNGLTRIEQTELIENLPLPEQLKDILLDYNNEEGYQGLHVSNFRDYIVNFIATNVLNVLAFLVSVAVVHVLIWAALTALNILAELPVIRIVNRFAGLLLGLLQALVLLWVFFLILSMISGTEIGLLLMNMVEKSEILSQLYESNLFLKVVTGVAAPI